MQIQELYTDKSNFDGLNKNIAIQADIIPSDGQNVLEEDIGTIDGGYRNNMPIFRYSYITYNDTICRKILLSSFISSISDSFFEIWVYDQDSNSTTLTTINGLIPITIETASTACQNHSALLFLVLKAHKRT
jgi:hypothetical protein